uniref:Uncharacterized protein n=1 Tax=Arundo donax TaxID=35708 RepID=A0A0A8ZHJ4_ARUDO
MIDNFFHLSHGSNGTCNILKMLHCLILKENLGVNDPQLSIFNYASLLILPPELLV